MWAPVFVFVSFLRFHLFLEKGEGREKKRERNINVDASHTRPILGAKPQPKHVSWLGIEPATLWLTGWHSIHWATQTRAWLQFLISDIQSFLNILAAVFFHLSHFTTKSTTFENKFKFAPFVYIEGKIHQIYGLVSFKAKKKLDSRIISSLPRD